MILDCLHSLTLSVELRQKAVRTAVAVVSGGYQTALVSYFLHKDFFPALMTVSQSSPQIRCISANCGQLINQLENPLRAVEPFLLTGLLSNYNKFEAANRYWTRFADFADTEAMKATVDSVGWTSMLLRERYVGIQDDTPAAWSISGTLSYIGLGSLAGAKPAPPVLTEGQQRELFLEQYVALPFTYLTPNANGYQAWLGSIHAASTLQLCLSQQALL